MGIIITYQNVEELVFYDKELHKRLPEFKKHWQGWALTKQQGHLKFICQRIMLDFLNEIEDKHIQVLSEYFKTEVIVKKIDTNVIHNYICNIDEAEDFLNSLSVLKYGFVVYRDENQLYISTWR